MKNKRPLDVSPSSTLLSNKAESVSSKTPYSDIFFFLLNKVKQRKKVNIVTHSFITCQLYLCKKKKKNQQLLQPLLTECLEEVAGESNSNTLNTTLQWNEHGIRNKTKLQMGREKNATPWRSLSIYTSRHFLWRSGRAGTPDAPVYWQISM